MNQEENLKQFYQEYHDWIEAGALKHPIFTRRHGLCTQLYNWLKGGFKHNEIGLMKRQFMEIGLPSDYPFNDGARHYYYELRTSLNVRVPITFQSLDLVIKYLDSMKLRHETYVNSLTIFKITTSIQEEIINV